MFSVFKGTVKGRKGFASLELRFCLFVLFRVFVFKQSGFLSLGARFEERLHGALELKKKKKSKDHFLMSSIVHCPSRSL